MTYNERKSEARSIKLCMYVLINNAVNYSLSCIRHTYVHAAVYVCAVYPIYYY